jgi:hypothetical protein
MSIMRPSQGRSNSPDRPWVLVGAAEAALGRRDRATAVERLRRAAELSSAGSITCCATGGSAPMGTALRATPLLDEVVATARRARLELSRSRSRSGTGSRRWRSGSV